MFKVVIGKKIEMFSWGPYSVILERKGFKWVDSFDMWTMFKERFNE